jgi:hypothetical protein
MQARGARHGSTPSWPSGPPHVTRNHATRSSYPDQLESRTSSSTDLEYRALTERSSANPSPHATMRPTPPKGQSPGQYDSSEFVPQWNMHGDHSPHVVSPIPKYLIAGCSRYCATTCCWLLWRTHQYYIVVQPWRSILPPNGIWCPWELLRPTSSQST